MFATGGMVEGQGHLGMGWIDLTGNFGFVTTSVRGARPHVTVIM